MVHLACARQLPACPTLGGVLLVLHFCVLLVLLFCVVLVQLFCVCWACCACLHRHLGQLIVAVGFHWPRSCCTFVHCVLDWCFQLLSHRLVGEVPKHLASRRLTFVVRAHTCLYAGTNFFSRLASTVISNEVSTDGCCVGVINQPGDGLLCVCALLAQGLGALSSLIAQLAIAC